MGSAPVHVLIIHSRDDAAFVDRLAGHLRDSGVEVWLDHDAMRPSGNVLDRVTRTLEEIRFVVPVVSQRLTSSSWLAHELSTWMIKEALGGERMILPVRYEACDVPSFLADHPGFDFCESFEPAAASLLTALTAASALQPPAGPASTEVIRAHNDAQIERIRHAFVRGKVTLFCGAGVSISAGIPGWKVFLRFLLSQFFDRSGSEGRAADKGAVSLARIYQEYFDLSPIIVAQYLKNALGADFQTTVRDALYASDPASSPLIDAVCELCRPQRERRALHGIVNFNFDDLIEQQLARNKIRHRAVFAEGQRHTSSELPIYHVHGYLPRDVPLDPGADIVFSEDAYHSKFIDPFSWSNLTQLNQLSQNTCLFVGLGMTDPNLRRLLDVAMRKNPDKTLEHFVFKKRYDVDHLARHMCSLEHLGVAEEHASKLVRMAEILEERDCNNLGLNVLWVDEFEEIPFYVTRIATP